MHFKELLKERLEISIAICSIYHSHCDYFSSRYFYAIVPNCRICLNKVSEEFAFSYFALDTFLYFLYYLRLRLQTWSEQYATSRELISVAKRSGSFSCTSLIALVLAASKHTSVASDAVVWMTPPPEPPGRCKKSSGSPIILPNQFMTIVSNSVHAGLEAYINKTYLKFKLKWLIIDMNITSRRLFLWKLVNKCK